MPYSVQAQQLCRLCNDRVRCKAGASCRQVLHVLTNYMLMVLSCMMKLPSFLHVNNLIFSRIFISIIYQYQWEPDSGIVDDPDVPTTSRRSTSPRKRKTTTTTRRKKRRTTKKRRSTTAKGKKRKTSKRKGTGRRSRKKGRRTRKKGRRGSRKVSNKTCRTCAFSN